MLQKGAVEKTTLELLGELTREPILSSARLVGGTSLALQIGHRKSTDLDFFTNDSPDIQSIVKLLYEKYDYKAQLIGEKATIGFINGVKIDVIHHPYKWLEKRLLLSPGKSHVKEPAEFSIILCIAQGLLPAEKIILGFFANAQCKAIFVGIKIKLPVFL